MDEGAMSEGIPNLRLYWRPARRGRRRLDANGQPLPQDEQDKLDAEEAKITRRRLGAEMTGTGESEFLPQMGWVYDTDGRKMKGTVSVTGSKYSYNDMHHHEVEERELRNLMEKEGTEFVDRPKTDVHEPVQNYGRQAKKHEEL